jgi:hypothetical protein
VIVTAVVVKGCEERVWITIYSGFAKQVPAVQQHVEHVHTALGR